MFAPIEGFSNYRVCHLGYVVKFPSLVKISAISNKSILYVDKKSYLQVRLVEKGVMHKFKLHRLVAEAFLPNPLGLKYVDHIDGDIMNNCSNNLRWISASKNNFNRSLETGKFLHGIRKRGNRYLVKLGRENEKSFETYLEAAKYRLERERETGEFFRDQIPEKVTLEILNEIVDGFNFDI